ncbi:MAG: YifB family Mg chelatase-like AAA ATPase [Patescibacteria group bacterium]
MANISRTFSAELDGIEAKLIEVETDINVGLHSFSIVGLADKALTEAKERVNSALKNTGVKPPNRENRKIVVNLAPADIKKTGSQYDLAIAVAYLLATAQLKPCDSETMIFSGELSLEGKLRPIAGALSIASLAEKTGKTLFIPKANAKEAGAVRGATIIPITSLAELIHHLEKRSVIAPQEPTNLEPENETLFVKLSEIKGQASAKRALMIAAAGGHNMLMVGPPGTGKTMLAQALASILPEPAPEEMIEITKVYSAANLLGDRGIIKNRPFRAPHQSASPAAMVGGGQNPRPGEISLAHRGVLFLDELPEFRRDILESLRQPLESGRAIVSRVKNNLIFPARFMLVAAMNPCPCGYYGDEAKACTCAPYDVIRYNKKVSGPLLDRIDIQITVPRVSLETLQGKDTEQALTDESAIKASIRKAHEIQKARTAALKHKFRNSDLSSKECDELITCDANAEQFTKTVFDKAMLSARGYYRILRVAQTIADLDESPTVSANHLKEAFSYRLREEA